MATVVPPRSNQLNLIIVAKHRFCLVPIDVIAASTALGAEGRRFRSSRPDHRKTALSGALSTFRFYRWFYRLLFAISASSMRRMRSLNQFVVLDVTVDDPFDVILAPTRG